MRNKIIILLSLVIIVANGLIGHFFGPIELTLTPFVIVITAALIIFATKSISIIWKSILVFLFIMLNDILIKLYSSGSHDYEGLGWIHFYMFMGVIPAGILLLIKILMSHEESIIAKITALILFPLLLFIHLQLFSHLGFGKYY